MASRIRTFHTGKLHTVKDGITLEQLKADGYFIRHPDAIIVKIPASFTLRKWDDAGICKAVDGCTVEPDGICQHGYPSWLLALGMI